MSSAIMRLPSRATVLWKKFVRDTGIPNPERFDRFAEARFPQAVVKLGPAENPDVEIRFADYTLDQNETPVYEILVRNPAITEIRFGGGEPIQLFAAPEVSGAPRIGKYIHTAESNTAAVSGIPNTNSVDFTEARRPIDEFRLPEPPAPPATATPTTPAAAPTASAPVALETAATAPGTSTPTST